MLPSFSAAWYKKSEERAKHADTAERLNETLSLFLKKRSQSFICLPDEVLGPSLFWRFDTTITQKKICISVLFSKQTNWNLKREVRAPNNTVIPNQCALLSWESPSNLRLYSPKDGDCHTSDVGHWFAMTGNSITRQIPISRTAALTADKRKNGIGRWYTPFFRFGMKLWEGATEKAFPGHPEQSDGRPADTQQLHFRDK